MRFAHAENQFEYRLNKELHMIQQQVPREQKKQAVLQTLDFDGDNSRLRKTSKSKPTFSA